MADTKNTEVPPASEPPAPVQQAPVVVRESRGWLRPLLAALIVVGALVVGGVGGFALAGAVHAGGRPPLEKGSGMPGPGQQGQGGPQQGPWQQGPGGQRPDGERPEPPSDTDSDDGGTEG
jgi:hypothetical protein